MKKQKTKRYGKGCPTKMIAGVLHFHRLCEICRTMVWTQDTRLKDYYCKTCVQPTYRADGAGTPRGCLETERQYHGECQQ